MTRIARQRSGKSTEVVLPSWLIDTTARLYPANPAAVAAGICQDR